MNHSGVTLDEIEVGMSASLSKTLGEVDIVLYSGITGDNNPVHVDEEFAKKTRFGTRIVQGMLTAGLISAILGTRLPGTGTIYIRQDLRFKAPVKIGDTAVATVTVREVNRERKRVILDTICKVGDTIVIEGEAEVMPPSKKA